MAICIMGIKDANGVWSCHQKSTSKFNRNSTVDYFLSQRFRFGAEGFFFLSPTFNTGQYYFNLWDLSALSKLSQYWSCHKQLCVYSTVSETCELSAQILDALTCHVYITSNTQTSPLVVHESWHFLRTCLPLFQRHKLIHSYHSLSLWSPTKRTGTEGGK